MIDWLVANPIPGAALITASLALLGVIVSLVVNSLASHRLEKVRAELSAQVADASAESQRQLEAVKATLTNANAERSAKRDYEYEARKRLYAQIEPLMFQLHEAAENSYFRVKSLVRSHRQGNLEGNNNWLGHEGYYHRSTSHRLVLPAVFMRVMQRQMTFVDMSLDEAYGVKYHLLKLYYFAFTDDFVLATAKPKLPYSPDKATPLAIEQNPAEFLSQGIKVGDAEKITDTLIVREEGILRPRFFGEFDLCVASESTRDAVSPLLELVANFSPLQRPVLARMLQAIGTLSHLIVESSASSPTDLEKQMTKFVDSETFAEHFSWSKDQVNEERLVIKDYLSERLRWAAHGPLPSRH